ncbi:MAG: Hg(II)-responsive transcriptional regulator [Chromatiaceae bacterium]|jgi:MerR family mercuric resistance operon transcriptional regulator|nr:Hg(II)-responsive transcriptional regulator [Chromatiaceae bacterium]
MKNTGDQLTIGALAKAAEVNVETIRFYQRTGLLSEPERPLGGIRRYGAEDVARVRFVKAAQRLGFSLDEIGQLLMLEDGARCEQARTLGQHKLADVRARISDLQHIEAALAALLHRCESTAEQVSCPLIDALQRESGDL